MRPLRASLALVLVFALAIVLSACGGDDDAATTTTSEAAAPTTGGDSTTAATAPQGNRIERTVAGGAVEGAPGRESVPVGEEVTIVVTADTSDEVHVHGYDLFADVTPGQPAEITFPADIPGVFEVELESAGLLLVELEVS